MLSLLQIYIFGTIASDSYTMSMHSPIAQPICISSKHYVNHIHYELYPEVTCVAELAVHSRFICVLLSGRQKFMFRRRQRVLATCSVFLAYLAVSQLVALYHPDPGSHESQSPGESHSHGKRAVLGAELSLQARL